LLAIEDYITIKFVKLGHIVIVSMESFNFIADGSSSFNSNEEISEGVLLFLRQSGGNFAKVGSSMKSVKIFVVGVVRPWNKRPP
jgi:hypothetical protein